MPARVIGKVPVPGHNRSSDVIRHVSIETISLKRVYDYTDNGQNGRLKGRPPACLRATRRELGFRK